MTDSSDWDVRQAALDVGHSFIVQAPAGSGKTELLIQRYLRLLATVREPEQVVAISFTRKAAAEMRTRVLHSLQAAADGATSAEAHRSTTLKLAHAVLRRDADRAWALLDQPQRMRIDTLDALNAWLARQLPILAGAAAGAHVVEDARDLYGQAARRTVDRIGGDGELAAALRRLLALADNSVSRLERLLAAALPMRDQWLKFLGLGSSDHPGPRIERTLCCLIETRLTFIQEALTPATMEQLLRALRHAGEHADPARPGLVGWLQETALEADTAARLTLWRSAGELMLTQKGQWRARFTKKEGFRSEDRGLAGELRQLLETLDRVVGFRQALAELSELPEPQLNPDQVEGLSGLQSVLTHLLAELRVLFEQRQSVDFIELALAAQQALGTVDAPSDLLLAMDQKIEHILVDEFQDTSHAQFRLLELLTAGWTRDDGRTLFLVGDPMQSIYRFRDADMSLFLRAKQSGLGNVACTHLVLRDNFRSAPAVVDWVNELFEQVFPSEDRLDAGMPRYYRSAARRAGDDSQYVQLHAVPASAAAGEQDRVIEILEQELASRPDQSIGILVQSRSHLTGLRQRLDARGWPAHAVEIDSVGETQLGQDLLGLTRALVHQGDRIAWLGVLRAPWCGLTWQDLEILCGDESDRSVWQLLGDADQMLRLSQDGRRRAESLQERLARGMALRGRYRFARWIECCWQLLDGPACLKDRDDIQLAEIFFRQLDGLTSGGDVDDPAQLARAYTERVGLGDVPREAGIEIMTIHRAKGLEFDTVILLGLAKRVRGSDPKILYWHELPNAPKDRNLLVAPFGSKQDRLQNYLQGVDQQLDQAERARLLYVAVTRARERLHLISEVSEEGKDPPRGSLAAWLGTRLAEVPVSMEEAPPASTEAAHATNVPLRRLVWQENLPLTPLALAPNGEAALVEGSEFEWVTPAAVLVGTLVHRELQRMAKSGDLESFMRRAARAQARYRRELALLGVPKHALDDAAERVMRVLGRVCSDATGRWIIGPQQEAQSEMRLTIRGPKGLEHLQLDRTFVDDKERRWIIDYKTSQHTGGNVETFLAAEVERYRDQLERYAAAMAVIDPRPIRVALYFPLLGALRDWTPVSVVQKAR